MNTLHRTTPMSAATRRLTWTVAVLLGERFSVKLVDPESVDWLARVRSYEDFAREQGLTFNMCPPVAPSRCRGVRDKGRAHLKLCSFVIHGEVSWVPPVSPKAVRSARCEAFCLYSSKKSLKFCASTTTSCGFSPAACFVSSGYNICHFDPPSMPNSPTSGAKGSA